MRILITSTYFEPYKSGLSTYAYRLARGLAHRGHEVVVLTSQHISDLALEEKMDGFSVVRVPVSFRLSKGVIMLSLPSVVRRWVAWSDLVNLHLPQFESFLIASTAKKLGKKILVTYHCDLEINGGWFSRLAGRITMAIGAKVVNQADLIVQNSMDYAESSQTLSPHLLKVREVPTPVVMQRATESEIADFINKYGIRNSEKLLGLAGRVAREKGYEYLIAALPRVLEAFPEARILQAGNWKGVVGEETYQQTIRKQAEALGDHWTTLGFLSDAEFRAFMAVCDVLVFASLNRTESFGIVQIEAMLQGTPVIASDLPGVRQPVLRTGMGKIVPIRNSDALSVAIIELLQTADKQWEKPEEYSQAFSEEAVAYRYESIMRKLVSA